MLVKLIKYLNEKSRWEREIDMIIRSGSFTDKHKTKALIRIFKALIFGKIKWTELKKFYSAMLHLERYLERLNPH